MQATNLTSTTQSIFSDQAAIFVSLELLCSNASGTATTVHPANHGWSRIVELMRNVGDRASRRRFANSYTRVGYRISVCTPGAASLLVRASTSSATQFHRRFPDRGPASKIAHQQMILSPLSNARDLRCSAKRGELVALPGQSPTGRPTFLSRSR
jgi:hypothetical protein